MNRKSRIVGEGYLVETDCSLLYNMFCIFREKHVSEKAVEIESILEEYSYFSK